jgi:tripartite-type tricarboxylate transporter receptor subunit TctC
MTRQGFDPVGGTPEQFAGFMREEIKRWERVVKTAGIKAQ